MRLVNDHHQHAVISGVRKTPTLIAVNTVILVVFCDVASAAVIIFLFLFAKEGKGIGATDMPRQ